MITIYYSYRSKNGEIKTAEKDFYDINKAVRFAYLCIKGKKLSYRYFTTNDSEENEEMWRRLP